MYKIIIMIDRLCILIVLLVMFQGPNVFSSQSENKTVSITYSYFQENRQFPVILYKCIKEQGGFLKPKEKVYTSQYKEKTIPFASIAILELCQDKNMETLKPVVLIGKKGAISGICFDNHYDIIAALEVGVMEDLIDRLSQGPPVFSVTISGSEDNKMICYLKDFIVEDCFNNIIPPEISDTPIAGRTIREIVLDTKYNILNNLGFLLTSYKQGCLSNLLKEQKQLDVQKAELFNSGTQQALAELSEQEEQKIDEIARSIKWRMWWFYLLEHRIDVAMNIGMEAFTGAFFLVFFLNVAFKVFTL